LIDEPHERRPQYRWGGVFYGAGELTGRKNSLRGNSHSPKIALIVFESEMSPQLLSFLHFASEFPEAVPFKARECMKLV